MRVIFLEDVPNVAHAGDIKNVKDGYARNYLIPKKIASVATAEHMKRIDRIKKAGDERRARETKQWEELASLLEGSKRVCHSKGDSRRRVLRSDNPDPDSQ